MQIKVVRSNQENWYSECINQIFTAFKYNNSPIIFFTSCLFFNFEDVEIVEGNDGIVPVLAMGIS